jgi:hypothetical protein
MKEVRKNNVVRKKGKSTQLPAYFTSETLEARRDVTILFKFSKKCHPRILYPVKILFSN